MSTRRSVAVRDPDPHDRITTRRGEVFDKYGCALHTVTELSTKLDDDRICPIEPFRA